MRDIGNAAITSQRRQPMRSPLREIKKKLRQSLVSARALLGGRSIAFLGRRSWHYAIHPRQLLRRLLLDPGPAAAGVTDDRMLADLLLHRGGVAWSGYRLKEAAALIQCASSIAPCVETSLAHASICLKTNQSDRATEIYRRAFLANPTHLDLRNTAGFHLFRHGTLEQIDEFCRSVLSIDSDDKLASFVATLQKKFPAYVEDLTRKIGGEQSQPVIIVTSVWGSHFVETFTQYTLASHLAPGNIPAVSQSNPVHVVVFTTSGDAAVLRADPLVQHASRLARVHLVEYDEVLFQATTLKSYPFPDVAKFGLMSLAHYAALETGRRCNAIVAPIGADNIVNDGFLCNALRRLSEGRDAVGVAGFRLPQKGTRAGIDKARRSDGSLAISPSELGELVCKYLPEECFVESRPFTSFPLFLCWRSGADKVLARANHYMPCALRGTAIKEALFPSIDPIDGGFLSKRLADPGNIHLSGDMDIALFEVSEAPLIDHMTRPNGFDAQELARWLWEYWNPLRERYLKQDIIIGDAEDTFGWDQLRRKAEATTAEILRELRDFGGDSEGRRSWRVDASPPQVERLSADGVGNSIAAEDTVGKRCSPPEEKPTVLREETVANFGTACT